MAREGRGGGQVRAWLGAALVPLAAACAPAMGGSTAALATASGQADVAAHSFVSAVDAGEVQLAQLAQARAQSQDVRTFAQRMISDHANALQVREAYLAQLGMELRASTGALARMSEDDAESGVMAGSGGIMGKGPFTSAMVLDPSGMAELNAVLMANRFSRPVARATMADLQALQQLSGAAFDRMYATRQVEMHQSALDNLDRMLAQRTLSPDVRGILTSQRAAVAMHLQMARQLRSRL